MPCSGGLESLQILYFVLAKWEKSGLVFLIRIHISHGCRGESIESWHFFICTLEASHHHQWQRRTSKKEERQIQRNIKWTHGLISVTGTLYMYVGWKGFNKGWTAQSFGVHKELCFLLGVYNPFHLLPSSPASSNSFHLASSVQKYTLSFSPDFQLIAAH